MCVMQAMPVCGVGRFSLQVNFNLVNRVNVLKCVASVLKGLSGSIRTPTHQLQHTLIVTPRY